MVQAAQERKGGVGVGRFGYPDIDDYHGAGDRSVEQTVPPLTWKGHALIWGGLTLPIMAFWLAYQWPAPFADRGAFAKPTDGLSGVSVAATYKVDFASDFGRSSGCKGTAVRTFTDTEGRTWPMGQTGLSYDHGANILGYTMVVPRDAAPGEGVLQAHLDWSCNWLQAKLGRSYDLPDLFFSVLPRPKD